MPLDVACNGVRRPVQFRAVTAADPNAWLMLIATPSSATAMLTVSPSDSASDRQVSLPSLARSSLPIAAPAIRTTPKPMAYLPRCPSCSTRLRDSSELTSREAVDLWTPSSVAISVMPASPFLASSSSTLIARSTDWTVPAAPFADSEFRIAQR